MVDTQTFFSHVSGGRYGRISAILDVVVRTNTAGSIVYRCIATGQGMIMDNKQSRWGEAKD